MENACSYVKALGDRELCLHQWNQVKSPIGAIQILHGMAEHAGRYEAFAKFLNDEGYVVYGHDHWSQGYSCKSMEELGYIGEDGFNSTVKDAHFITNLIKEKHPGLPVFIFAHSFGSFVGQDFITHYGLNIDGIILSGSAAQNGIDVSAGAILATLQKRLIGGKKKGKLLDSLSFGSYNKSIKEPSTSFDWLSRDTGEVSKYCDDPRCGYVFPIDFYYYFFKGLKKLYQADKLRNVPLTLPIYIMSGERDPVGHFGKSVKALYEIYRKLGIEDITLKLYPEGRHEMLNEINRNEVFRDIADWLSKHK